MRAGKVKPYKGKNGRWYWRAVAANGQIVADSSQGNGYANPRNAREGAKAAARALLAHFGDEL